MRMRILGSDKTRIPMGASDLNSFSPSDDLAVFAKKYTQIRQLLRSCLIWVYLFCKIKNQAVYEFKS